MLMTYEDVTSLPIGRRAEEWTRTFLERLAQKPTQGGNQRRLNGHFSFDFILSTKNDVIYPIECNARVHTAVIMLPLDDIAGCYDDSFAKKGRIVRPRPGTAPRSWLYNDLVMRYLPLLVPSRRLLSLIHPSLPACALTSEAKHIVRPREDAVQVRVDPTLVADDWVPFIVLWHVFWPFLLVSRWWQGKKWTRVSPPSFPSRSPLMSVEC
jgi:hypothetical protein